MPLSFRSLPVVAMDSMKGGPDSSFNDNLIREVRRNPIVYDASHPLYGNALKKQETWGEIAGKLGEKVEAVKTRWRTLRDRYTKERRRVTTLGGGSTFSYYSDLSFLDHCTNENRKSHNNLIGTPFKPEFFDQASDGSDDIVSHQGEINRVENQEIAHMDENEASVSNHGISNQRFVQPTIILNDQILEDILPNKRAKVETNSQSTSDSVADALFRSAEALQRIADRRLPGQRLSTSIVRDLRDVRDVDECFADFVCMALKAIDNESRVHARIAILHALAQYQI